jgi:outer membrane protein OmpA-like peptidoglycan-associated protein
MRWNIRIGKTNFMTCKLHRKSSIFCLLIIALLPAGICDANNTSAGDSVKRHQADTTLTPKQRDSLNPKNVGVEKSVQPSFPVIYFHWERYDLDSTYCPLLNSVAAIMKVNSGMNLEINGYTDNIGEESYNSKLSLLRAGSVAKYLYNQGIDNSRVIYKGLGAAHFVAPNDGLHNHMNRRVEILFIK